VVKTGEKTRKEADSVEAQIVAQIIFDLFIIFLAAKIAAELFERIKQPAVIGELLAGVIIGPVLGLLGSAKAPLKEFFVEETAKTGTAISSAAATVVAKDANLIIFNTLAELGVIILLFKVGLETNLSALLRVGGQALIVAIAGVVLPFMLGGGLIWALGFKFNEVLFVGAAMVATSVGITARVLSDLGRLQTPEGRIILGAAVIDDVLGLLVLTVVKGMAREGIQLAELITLIIFSLGFVVLVVLVGVYGIKRFSTHLDSLHISNPYFAVGLAVCLGLAAAAAFIGLAAIIGAFLAGLIFGESRERDRLEHAINPIYELLVPVFFVITGSKTDLSSFTNLNVLGLAAAITVLAILGKFVGCGLASLNMGRRSAAIIGVGMAPRGEVGLIVASIGLGAGIFTAANGLYSVIVIMSIVTTLFVPPLLKILFTGYKPRPVEEPAS
jgi:Kef-type K+ transport system membrane component KefB